MPTTSRPRTTASALVAAGLEDGAQLQTVAAGMTRSGAFTWKTHLDGRYEGYRLGLKVEPETDAPEGVATELTSQVLHGLRRAGLIGTG